MRGAAMTDDRGMGFVLNEDLRACAMHFRQYKDGTLDEVIKSLLAIREMVPAEYRDSARCGIDSVGSYEDSHYATIEVSYIHSEATLAALKAKYEGAK
jgi:hypothetical protein